MMTKNQTFKTIMLFFSFFCALSYANVTYNKHDNLIHNCINKNSACDLLKIPEELKDDIIDSHLSIDVFFGKKYLLMTPVNNSTANICYSVHLINNSAIQLAETNLLGEYQSLCIYEKNGTELINRFRDAAKWHEVLYRENNERYQLVLEDQCIGCGIIERTYYDSGKNNQYVMVTDNESLSMRKPVIKKVIEQTRLLNTPSLEDKTKMYLIEGDKVKLLKRQDSFYLIEYDSQRKGSIKKWLSCSAIDAC